MYAPGKGIVHRCASRPEELLHGSVVDAGVLLAAFHGVCLASTCVVAQMSMGTRKKETCGKLFVSRRS